MKKLSFVKMQGTGNDFILINDRDLKKLKLSLNKELIKHMCCRHFGIGADGLLIVSKGKKVPFKYVMYNPDGSRAEMCGNGIRCYMKYLIDNKLIEKKNVDVETGVGILNLDIDDKIVTVDMGVPSKIKNLVYKSKALGDKFPLKVENEEFIFIPVSMGNPHAVIFCRKSNILCEHLENFAVEKYGKKIENYTDIFPDRTNVEFVKILSDREIIMRVWERGAGETLACGTGACASVVAGILSGNLLKNEFIKVNLPGGILEVKWSGNEKESVIMKGEARKVYEGMYYLD